MTPDIRLVKLISDIRPERQGTFIIAHVHPLEENAVNTENGEIYLKGKFRIVALDDVIEHSEGFKKTLTALESDNPTVQAHISILNKIYDLKDYILGKPNKTDEVFHIIEQFRELDKDKLHKYVEVREKAASSYRALQQLFQSNDVKTMIENLQEAVVRHQISNRDLKLKNQEYFVRIEALVKEKSDIEKKLQGYEIAEWVRKDPRASWMFQRLQEMTEPQKQFIYKFCANLIEMQKEADALMKG